MAGQAHFQADISVLNENIFQQLIITSPPLQLKQKHSESLFSQILTLSEIANRSGRLSGTSPQPSSCRYKCSASYIDQS